MQKVETKGSVIIHLRCCCRISLGIAPSLSLLSHALLAFFARCSVCCYSCVRRRFCFCFLAGEKIKLVSFSPKMPHSLPLLPSASPLEDPIRHHHLSTLKTDSKHTEEEQSGIMIIIGISNKTIWTQLWVEEEWEREESSPLLRKAQWDGMILQD